MKLGILVNTDRHIQQLSSITRAALLKGHEVSVFVMDRAVHLLDSGEIAELSALEGVSVGYCNYNSMSENICIADLPVAVNCGSQLDNAIMMRDSDRVITL